MKIVLVEDSVIVRARLTLQLARIQGVQVVGHAASEDEAVDMVDRKRPDLVLMDIGLESGNGINALKRIRKSGNRTRVWILSNCSVPDYRELVRDQGVEHFFAKNSEIEQLMARVKDMHCITMPGSSYAESLA
ncbi:MAG: response regulator transcription factor [Oxalicibacterium faecigallinarum]|uniref:Response regulatory domain-containing protein n=1 Tax=Oxalicibacterium faecigallinarum TaxID=573741 RepID=A0A8J3ASY7_9BURK|nr:response regulator transcription factor [Oxalicibacterium faecigallinarum]MDQ7970405.1 response regulator transcription factor [Oxalicibacterium faecigallinarum]GGI20722.1 hypothetical protein GCM10008066_25450 [Oxalicibacterium faecigallinarum]